MYGKRVKIFVIVISVIFSVCVVRLFQMQLVGSEYYREQVNRLHDQRNRSVYLKTLRGRILDRNGKILAEDEPHFELQVTYELSSVLDDRVRRSMLLRVQNSEDSGVLLPKVQKEIDTRITTLRNVIEKCSSFGVEPEEVQGQIEKMNGRIWAIRQALAWKRNYGSWNEFVQDYPTEDQQLVRISRIDIAEMYQPFGIVQLKTDDEIYSAQVEFMDVKGINIALRGVRKYPYSSVAAQTIGWVGPATQAQDVEVFVDDDLLRYFDNEVCGREDGVEYVCEEILRGRRGQEVYNIDKQLREKTEQLLGSDVTLTLDIELQQRVESYLQTCELPENCGPGMSVIVVDVNSSDILVLASVPTYDLNTVREHYGKYANDKAKCLLNRALNQRYPPGSIVKPLILIAGLENNIITPEAVISCPSSGVPAGWPRCWINRQSSWHGHDDDWPNNGRNAIRGSCNIYFSRLAERIEARKLQWWIRNMGFGRKVQIDPDTSEIEYAQRRFRQLSGVIYSGTKDIGDSDFDNVPALKDSDRRWFGIGQADIRTTPLQVANFISTLARGGVEITPRLFADKPKSPPRNTGISGRTLNVILDGMHAVVSEQGGTAESAFKYDSKMSGLRIYGKTGSTQSPANAWFGGWAKDGRGRALAVVVLIEGGQSGGHDASPVAKEVLGYCVDAGYLGSN